MSGVDDRIVSLKFDNKQFESASAQSMTTLDKLKKSLDFSASNKSLNGLQQTAGRFNLGNIGTTIEGISTKFLTMGTIGVTALVQITQQALATGEQMLKALTIDPVMAGFGEYSTNLNSIQTILSNTMAAGTNLKQVNAALKELNDYSDKTIYNFSEMARNIGTFTAAGVALKPATAAIKGIANLAALSGSNSQQAATAMYQLSQAISAGKISLMDWNSVVNAGMGGTVFQRALAQTAVKMGTIKEGAIKLQGPMKNITISGLSFRQSISDPKVGGWLTSGVLTKTLAQFTGDLKDADLAAQGFSKSEIKAIQAQAKAAQEAATQVKTISQAFDVAKETAGSGWAQSWQIIFGDFGTAKKDMTALSNFINGIINKNSDERNKLLADWAKNGGRIAGVQALKAAFQALSNVIKPIQEAWANVFPATTGKQLADTTKAIRDFFRSLILGPKQMAQIRTAFQGFFSVLKIGKTIISEVFGFIQDIFGLLTRSSGPAAGGLLDVAASVGEALTNFERFLNGTNAIPAFFDRLYNSVAPVVNKIRDFANSVRDVLGSGIAQVVQNIQEMGKAATTANDQGVTPLAEKWQAFAGFFSGVGDIITNVVDAIKSAFTGFSENGLPDVTGSIMDNLQKINWVNVFKATIGTGFVAGVGLMIKGVWEFIDSFRTVKGIGKAIIGSFDQLKDTLKSYQKEIRARTLLMIAGAILALALAVKILASVPVPQLIISIAAMKLMFMMLNQSFESMGKIADSKGIARVPFIAGSLILIAGSMIIFAAAIKLFSMMDPGELIKGVTTMGAIVLGIVATAKLLEKAQGDILRFGAGMLFLAFAMNVFAAAIFVYSKMDPSTIMKGGFVVVALVGALGLAMRAFPKEGQMLKAAAALLVTAFALNMLVVPIAILGNMDFGTLVKGIGALGVILLGLAIALNAMSGTLAGSAAMLVAAVALTMLAHAVEILGNLGLGTLLVGLLGLVLVMAAVAGASLLLLPAVPAILAFGAAMLVLGAGFALLGAGALAFATAMSIIVTIMSLGMPILEDTITNFTKLIPLLADAFKTFLVEFANAFTDAIPAIARSVETMVRAIIKTLENLIPDFVDLGITLFDNFVTSLVAQANILYDAAWSLLAGFLGTIDSHLPAVIKRGTSIIITLITGIGKAAKDILIAAGTTMLNFMKGITDWLNTHADDIGNAGRDLAGAIVNGFTGGMASRVSDAVGSVTGFFGNVIDAARNALDSHSPSRVFIKIGKDVTAGFVIGVAGGKDQVVQSMSAISDAIKQAKLDSLDHIKDLKKKIHDLKSDDTLTTKQKAQLAQYEADLKVAEAEQKKLTAAYKTISVERKKQKAQLIALAKDYDSVSKKLDAARDKLDEARKQRDDFKQSITDQYSVLPDIPGSAAVLDAQKNLNDAQTEYNNLLADSTSSADQLSAALDKVNQAQETLGKAKQAASLDAYFDQIRKQTEANLKFKATLEQLRKLGLDDNQYKKFLEQGTEIQPFLDQLLAAGGNTIAELNTIDATLTSSATSLGQSASQALYQAGVDSAKGLVDGLTAQLDTIKDKMKTIGKAIADEIKKELGIKSPSKVFKEIGKFVVHGLRDGIDDNANVVDISTKRLGKDAVESLKESLSGLSGVVATDVNLSPTIAPVLDLDAFRKDATRINDILTPKTIVPTTSATVANDISNKTAAIALALQEQQLAATGTTVEFTQNNTSPVALSSAEIYRQTKNAISTVKGALKN